MAKVSFANMKLKVDSTVKEVIVSNGTSDFTIEVLQYLPIQDKYDLVTATLQEAEENGIYDEVLLETYLMLNLIYAYTNIQFTDRQKDNPSHLYDLLESNNVIDTVMTAIPKEEYDFIRNSLEENMRRKVVYDTSFVAIFSKFINDLPANMQQAVEIVNNFEPEKFQKVIDFATAANGGRPIDLNS